MCYCFYAPPSLLHARSYIYWRTHAASSLARNRCSLVRLDKSFISVLERSHHTRPSSPAPLFHFTYSQSKESPLVKAQQRQSAVMLSTWPRHFAFSWFCTGEKHLDRRTGREKLRLTDLGKEKLRTSFWRRRADVETWSKDKQSSPNFWDWMRNIPAHYKELKN